MASHASKKVSHGFIGDNPGWVAAFFAIAVTAGFLGLIYNSATSHHEPAHGAAPRGAAPHAASAEHAPAGGAAAPAASTPAAHH
jgi:hypothetical protein